MYKENSERYPSRTGDILMFVYFQLGSKPTKRLTDIQEIRSYLEIGYKPLRNVSKKFEKDSSSRTRDIQRKPNFSKEVRQ